MLSPLVPAPVAVTTAAESGAPRVGAAGVAGSTVSLVDGCDVGGVETLPAWSIAVATKLTVPSANAVRLRGVDVVHAPLPSTGRSTVWLPAPLSVTTRWTVVNASAVPDSDTADFVALLIHVGAA